MIDCMAFLIMLPDNDRGDRRSDQSSSRFRSVHASVAIATDRDSPTRREDEHVTGNDDHAVVS